MLFVVIVVMQEARYLHDGAIATPDGTRCWLTCDEWVAASSRKVDDENVIPINTKTFQTVEEADAFANRWKGHPWYCKPHPGRHEVIAVKPRYRQVHDGFERL